MHVNNCTAECWSPKIDGSNNLSRDSVLYLVLHRISLANFDRSANPDPVPEDELDGPGLAHRFRNRGLGTGGKVPYHFLVRRDGTVDQLLPLHVRGSHAVGVNASSWAISIAGERWPARVAQLESVVSLCALLAPLAVKDVRVIGHTQIPGGSNDARKVCPQPVVDPDEVRRLVAAAVQRAPNVSAEDAGVVL